MDLSGSRGKLLAFAVAPALVTGGIAIAAEGGGGQADPGAAQVAPGGPAFAAGGPGGQRMRGVRMGGMRRNLVEGDLKLYVRGRTRTVHIDRGKLTAKSDDSLTLKRLDGSTVSVPVNEDTRVGMGGRRAALEDIPDGATVVTIREGNGPAKAVRVPPAGPRRR